jgi:curved DNA-binding protein CbpA
MLQQAKSMSPNISQQVREAYEVLGDADEKAGYDEYYYLVHLEWSRYRSKLEEWKQDQEHEAQGKEEEEQARQRAVEEQERRRREEA